MSETELRARIERFWPKQVAYDAVFAFAVIAVLAYFSGCDA